MTAEEMWREYGGKGDYEAWAFGSAPDKLAELVIEGKKRATSSALPAYEADGEDVPKSGDLSIILYSDGSAACIIKTTAVTVLPYDEISENMASLEGEGDLSLEYWRDVHREFFSDEMAEYGLSFDEKMPVVFEEFEVIYK